MRDHAALNITGPRLLARGNSLIRKVIVIDAGEEPGGVFDGWSPRDRTALQLAVIPCETGKVIELDAPCSTGLIIRPGREQTVAVVYVA